MLMYNVKMLCVSVPHKCSKTFTFNSLHKDEDNNNSNVCITSYISDICIRCFHTYKDVSVLSHSQLYNIEWLIMMALFLVINMFLIYEDICITL